ncbi:hypothetical protein SKAU_G00151480 [Synaphobranchus kaupii]|uniref:Uncharacterized protein n=1 Tax=Synaphobranchus kaupii TaxID=118154 RepID=A0A9Q1IYG5_SYNKA|nr:hypothetical protein SKAU_G00151480 [Synaphobranchus kaupii]
MLFEEKEKQKSVPTQSVRLASLGLAKVSERKRDHAHPAAGRPRLFQKAGAVISVPPAARLRAPDCAVFVLTLVSVGTLTSKEVLVLVVRHTDAPSPVRSVERILEAYTPRPAPHGLQESDLTDSAKAEPNLASQTGDFLVFALDSALHPIP